MKERKGLYLSLVFLLLLYPVLASAQVNTGILAGTVLDEEGQPLPGAEVSVSSPALISPQLSRITTEKGLFRFPYLPPGTYSLIVKLSGFNTYQAEKISVLLNLTTELKIILQPAKIESEIIVTSAAPVVSVENTKLATNIDASELKNLPVARNVDAAFNLAPGVLKGSSFGSGTRENSWNADGVQVTDPGSGSGMSATQSMDAYEEVQVETAGHPAEFGNAGGAVINVITKSGGNAFHGEGSVYFTNSDLQASNIKGTEVSAPTTETLYNYGFNFNLGGPVIKDKLWFFISSGYAPSKFRYAGFAVDVPYATVNPLVKLTFQPHINHRISINFNYNRTRNPYMFASQFRTPEACFNATTQAYTYQANWLWTISPSTIFELRAFHLKRPTDYLSRGQGVIYYDYATNIMSGSSNECLQQRLRWQSNATLTEYIDNLAGSHEIKAGFEFERGESKNAANYFPDEYGMIEYDTYGGVPLYAYQIIPPRTTAQIDPYNQFAGFVQDSWKINKYLVANVGLRYDYVDVYHPPQREQTTRLPLLNWKTLEPRIALGIDPFGDGKTGIKIGYSRFAQMMWTWFYSLNPNGQKMIMYYVVAPGVFFPIYESEAYNFEMDPDIKRPYVDEFLISVDRAISKDLALKISFVDRQFRKTVTANDLHITADWFEPIQVINPLTNQPMTVYDLKSGAPTSTLDYYSNDPHAKKHYQGIVAELDKKLSNNYMFRISYNFSRIRSTSVGDNMGSSMYATGYWNWPNNSLYDYGLTDSTMHVFKFQGIWYAPFGIILSAGYLGQSGYQYAATFREALNIGFTTFYAEAPSSRRMPFVHYLDFKVGKDFKLGNSNLSVFADIYNALNLNAATDVYSILGSPLFGKTIGIQSGRLVQFGARIQF